jgi:hypothetical protein
MSFRIHRGNSIHVWAVLAVLGFAILMIVEFNKPDLRGWPQNEPPDPSILIQPTRSGGAAFFIGDCLDGTIRWDPPASDEYSGTATLAVLTCRSRSKFLSDLFAYAAVAIASLVIVVALRRHRRASNK